MSGLILTITDAGRAALVNAGNTGTNPVLMASVGVSATSFTPSPATTILPDEIKRISTIAGEAVADDTIHVTVRDESADVYTVRSFGLYLADGTLFAVYSQADPIMEKSAQALLLLAIDVIFADIEATNIAFGDASFSNPPATTERQGVVELATDAETETGSDAVRAVTPKGLKAAVTKWLNDRFGEGAPSAFIKGLLTSASAAALRTSLEIKSAALKDEGDGKGLDADLLDGKHGSEYAPAAHTHPIDNVTGLQAALNGKLAASNYTAADVLAKLVTVDGSGSGLDADLWDGVHRPNNFGTNPHGGTAISTADPLYLPVGGSAFTTHANNGFAGQLTYAAMLAGGDVADRGFALSAPHGTGHLKMMSGHGVWTTIWTEASDGAGSGLDADKLDGYDEDWFLRYRGTVSMLAAGDLRAAGLYRADEPGFARLLLDLQTRDPSSTPRVQMAFTYGSSILLRTFQDDLTSPNPWVTLWTSGNDGPHSGLDADLLDGLHASDFAKIADFVASKTTNGYCRLPNGMIIQAGRYTQSANSLISVVFPLAFPNLCMGVVTGGTGDTSESAEGNTPTVYSGSVTTGGFQSHSANDNSTTAYFIAFGY